jgi:acetyltransferase-like isoleucine patch superfamily enzyme
MNLRKVLRNSPLLPWELGRLLKQEAMMMRHRNLAVLGAGTKVLVDGWITNPAGVRERIQIGENSVIRGDLFVPPTGGQISIGDWCFVGQETYIWSAAKVRVGDRVLISHHVNIQDNNSHSMDSRQRHAQFRAISTTGHPYDAPGIESAPITIGDDVWIGYGASIGKGVTIGEGAVVAFRAVVLDDVAPWTVVAGFPARAVKTLKATTRES